MLSIDSPVPAATVSRWLTTALVAALVLHAGILAGWLYALLAGPDARLLPGMEWRAVVALACLLVLLALLVFFHAARRAMCVTIAAAACALIGVGAVATIGAMALSAHVLGSVLLDWSAKGAGTRDAACAERPSAALRVLVGSCAWIALIGATLTLDVHYAAVYILFVAASLLAFPATARRSVAAAAGWLAADDRSSAPERMAIGLAGAIFIVHLVVVAKPEVGYDASAMHLQFAELVARHHRWDFDVGRYVWAVMPMGADFAYLAAFLVGGEAAARLQNLLFGLLLCATVYEVVRSQASRVVGLFSVCLLASSPIWFLESGTLYVEFAWTAFLVASLAATLRYARRREPVDFAAAAMCCAGAMACKAIGLFWVAPLAVALMVLVLRNGWPGGGRLVVLSLLAASIGSWAYVNAWVRTGNPVFPFMNTIFASPLFPTSAPFNNPLYNAPLSLSTPYDLVMHSGRYLEGLDGAAGIQWLLLFPVIGIGLLGRARRLRVALLALAAGFAIAVYVQQSYLRYLFPAFVLLAILAGCALGDWIRSPAAAAALMVTGIVAVLVNVGLMPSASWTNASLCLRCSLDAEVRADYVARNAPLRVVADYLNRNLPDARVGFFVFNGPGASGYVGYSRAANWHDVRVFQDLAAASTVDEVAAVVRRYALTHAVFVARSQDPLDRVLIEYRDARTAPVARFGNFVLTAIRPEADDATAASASSAR